MTTVRVWSSVFVASFVVLAACGGSSTSDDQATDAGPSTSAEAPPTTDAAETDSTAVESSETATREVESSSNDAEPADTMADDVGQEPEAVPPVEFPLTISDALGNEFTFDEPVTFGCVFRTCTELHADLGVPEAAGSVLYAAGGNTESSIFYPAGPPSYIVADYRNPEDWAGSDVDAVVSRVPQNPLIENTAGDLALTYYVHSPTDEVSSLAGLDAYLDNLWRFGQMLDRPQAAANKIGDYEAMIANLSALSTPELAARTVSVLVSGEEYFLMSERSPFCDVIQTTGLGNCVSIGDNSEVNAEAYLALDPDWIVYYPGVTTAAERTDAVWPELSAVQNGQAYDSVNGDYHCCSARTLVVALQEFVHFSVPGADMPAPTEFSEFDPSTSPLFER